MKLALIIAATLCIGWLLNVLFRLHEHREIQAYLLFAALAGVLAYVVELSKSYLVYLACFGLALIPVCFSAIYIAGRWALSLGWDYGIIGLGVSLIVATYFVCLLWREVPHSIGALQLLFLGFCLLFAGILSLASTVPPCSSMELRLRAVFGTFWLICGAFYLSYSVGVVRSKAVWTAIGDYTSQLLCIVFLGGLALMLSSHQNELATQEIRGQAVAHAPIYEGEQ